MGPALWNLPNASWHATASPARPTERSERGTTASVSVAIKNFVDNRPTSICLDVEGTMTSNAQLTARLMVLAKVDILILAGYLECGIGFVGSNHELLIDMDLHYERRETPLHLWTRCKCTP